jgi:hypothetical protein
LKILGLEAEQVLTIEALQIEHLELSPNDLSVYILRMPVSLTSHIR